MSATATRTAGRPKAVVLGMMTKMPVAGVVWQNLHYLLGFERLGYEAFYVETHGLNPSMLMSSEHDDSSLLAAEFIGGMMRRFGFGGRWAFRALHTDGACFGMSEQALARLCRTAEIVLNLHGGTAPLPELAAGGRLVYVETDPVLLQLELGKGARQAIDFLEPHSAFFTFAENWGRPDCLLPIQDRFRFVPTRQPVVLELWPDRSAERSGAFTTIGNWRQEWRDVTFAGERYTWSKHHEFAKYLDLPSRTGSCFELALSSCSPQERERIAAKGWVVHDGLVLSRDPDTYRDYVGSSRAEFTVAKDQNVRLRSGWFSDRSATYLASGRPVVTQDTGFSAALPTGAGLLAFGSPDAAADAVARVEADYRVHASAARELAREHFAHDVVLAGMLEHLGAPIPAGRRHRDIPLFPASMALEPTSRRPTMLAPATAHAAVVARLPGCAVAPPLGEEGASIVIVTHEELAFTRLCLATVLAHTPGCFELIVVDNGSRDGTVEYLGRVAREDARVRVLVNGRNLGFAAACNEGLALARGERLVLLNNDTLVAPEWLPRLLAHLRNAHVGLVGPVTNRIGTEAEVETDYGSWAEFLEHAGERARDRAGDWIEVRTPAMFCLAMRRDVHVQLGPLDERYEVGMLEDDDYAELARAAGYQLRCAEDVLVHHFAEASFGRLVADGEHARILRANRRRFAEKWTREWQPYPRRRGPGYEHDAERLREAVEDAVPSGATVLVISRGDEALLRLDGRRALHFPQAADGGWAGHHPADSGQAISELEVLRREGAQYLAVPPTYGWWLDHYGELRSHLEVEHERLVSESGGLAIYRLQEAG